MEAIELSTRLSAIAAAQGQAPFDLLLTGGRIVDVATLELREADVGIVGPLIASVHPRGRFARCPRDPEVAAARDRPRLYRRPRAFRILAHAAAPLCGGGRAAGHHHDFLRSARARQRARDRWGALRGRGQPRAAAALHRAGLLVRAGSARARNFRCRFPGGGAARAAVVAGDRKPGRGHGHARGAGGAAAHGRHSRRGAGVGKDHRRACARAHGSGTAGLYGGRHFGGSRDRLGRGRARKAARGHDRRDPRLARLPAARRRCRPSIHCR